MTETYCIKDFKELSKLPNSSVAKATLEKLISATKMLLVKRKWTVKVLKEFYPEQAGLLGMNVNRGASIMIRLRDPHDQNLFLPWESVLGTLIHELTHNSIGEHSAEFYKMMDTLWDEYESTNSGGFNIKSSGPSYTFDGSHNKLGGKSNIPPSSKTKLSQLAAEAALKRQKNNEGVYKLGGGVGVKELTPQELRLLAAEAAERRMRDETTCFTRGNNNNIRNNNSNNSNTSNINNNNNNKVSLVDMWVCDDCVEQNYDSIRCGYCGSDHKEDEDKKENVINNNTFLNDNKKIIKENKSEIKLIDLTKDSPITKKSGNSSTDNNSNQNLNEVICNFCTYINIVGNFNCEICENVL